MSSAAPLKSALGPAVRYNQKVIAMPQLVFGRTICLDSATIGKLSYDYCSNDPKRNQAAKHIMSWLVDHGLFILITFHHIEELLQVEDERTVAERISLIKRLPVVVWPRRYDFSNGLGDIVDLISLEVEAIINSHSSTRQEIINIVKNDILRYGSGEDLVTCQYDEWMLLRPHWIDRISKKRQIASITHSGATNESVKLKEYRDRALRSKDEAFRITGLMARKLGNELKVKGDEKLKNPDLVAREFMKHLFDTGLGIYDFDGDPIEGIFDIVGVDKSKITDEMTISQIGYLATIQKKLEVAIRRVGINYNDIKDRIYDNVPPSLFIDSEIEKASHSQQRGSGSNLNDRHIMGYAFYADFIEVDKRTLDSLDRVMRIHPVLKQMLGTVFRLKDYKELPNIVR